VAIVIYVKFRYYQSQKKRKNIHVKPWRHMWRDHHYGKMVEVNLESGLSICEHDVKKENDKKKEAKTSACQCENGQYAKPITNLLSYVLFMSAATFFQVLKNAR